MMGKAKVVDSDALGSRTLDVSALDSEQGRAIRIVTPDRRWNQTSLVRTEDTVMVYFFGEKIADKTLRICTGKFFLALFAYLNVFQVLIQIRVHIQLPTSIWYFGIPIVPALTACVFPLLNRHLFVELLFCFDTWYVSINGVFAGALCIHGFYGNDFWFGAFSGVLMTVAFPALTFGDAFHPLHKKFILKLAIFQSITTFANLLYAFHIGSIPPGFEERSIRFGLSESIDDKMSSSMNNVSLLSRTLVILGLFCLRFLYRAIKYPNK